MINENDSQSRRCPKLGHDIKFSYCRNPGLDVPCSKIFDCWWEKFDIKKFMEENYSKEIIEKINEPVKPKTFSLLEIIEQAEKRISKDSIQKSGVRRQNGKKGV